jgi:hypothetical protein
MAVRRLQGSHPPTPAVRDLARLIGQAGFWRDYTRPQRAAIWWAVRICDVKVHWGKARVLLEPAKGRGQFWTDLDRVKLGRTPPKK